MEVIFTLFKTKLIWVQGLARQVCGRVRGILECVRDTGLLNISLVPWVCCLFLWAFIMIAHFIEKFWIQCQKGWLLQEGAGRKRLKTVSQGQGQ